MKNTKMATILILFAYLLAGCGGEAAAPETSAPDTTTAPAPETELTDGLEGYDFDGRTFRIVYSADQLGAAWPYDAETENGDLLNDKVFARNTAVEERFNVSIEMYSTGGTTGEVPTALLNSIMAGDGEYQLAISHTFNRVPTLISEAALADFNQVPNIDLEKPWWNASVRNNLSILGILPIGVSDHVYSYADVIYVNRDLMEEFKLEDTYDLVNDGRWTWTKLSEMAKAVSSDVNGDGQFKKGDRFGFTFPGETESLTSRMIHSNGMLLAELNEEGLPVPMQMSDRLQTTIERYYDLLYTGNQTYIGTKTDASTSVEAFIEGNILFMHQTTLQLPSMRNTDVNFGIVPLPKFDEAQENYMSMLSSQILLISNVDDAELEFIGTITEALSYESWKHVTPAVYESIFENKYLRDATSYEMYQQIRDSLVCDFNWNYGESNALTYLIRDVVYKGKSTDVSSKLASVTPAVQKKYDALIESVRENYLKN